MYLHHKHGINPTMTTCFLCRETKDILLVGAKIKAFKKEGLCSKDGEMNHQIGCIDKEPCQKCKEIMEQGIIFISTKDDDIEYRTGGWCAIKESAVRKMGIKPESMLNDICKSRVCFIQDSVYDSFELPRGQEINNLKAKEAQNG